MDLVHSLVLDSLLSVFVFSASWYQGLAAACEFGTHWAFHLISDIRFGT